MRCMVSLATSGVCFLASLLFYLGSTTVPNISGAKSRSLMLRKEGKAVSRQCNFSVPMHTIDETVDEWLEDLPSSDLHIGSPY